MPGDIKSPESRPSRQECLRHENELIPNSTTSGVLTLRRAARRLRTPDVVELVVSGGGAGGAHLPSFLFGRRPWFSAGGLAGEHRLPHLRARRTRNHAIRSVYAKIARYRMGMPIMNAIIAPRRVAEAHGPHLQCLYA